MPHLEKHPRRGAQISQREVRHHVQGLDFETTFEIFSWVVAQCLHLSYVVKLSVVESMAQSNKSQEEVRLFY